MIKDIVKNWKTSLLGTGALSGAILNYIQNPNDVQGSLLMAIVGLIGLFAKDSDKSHTIK